MRLRGVRESARRSAKKWLKWGLEVGFGSENVKSVHHGVPGRATEKIAGMLSARTHAAARLLPLRRMHERDQCDADEHGHAETDEVATQVMALESLHDHDAVVGDRGPSGEEDKAAMLAGFAGGEQQKDAKHDVNAEDHLVLAADGASDPGAQSSGERVYACDAKQSDDDKQDLQHTLADHGMRVARFGGGGNLFC